MSTKSGIFDTGLGKIISEELSGENASKHMLNISKYDRLWGSKEVHKALAYVEKELRKVGIDEIKRETIPMDGETKTWAWKLPMAWESEEGSLHLVYPEKKVLATIEKSSLPIYDNSAATPEDGIEAELVFIGKGCRREDYLAKNLRGKILLLESPENFSELREQMKLFAEVAVREMGAIGMISYNAKGDPTLLRWKGFHISGKETPFFGFHLCRNDAEYLKGLLRKGTVRVWVKIKSRFFKGKIENLYAIIRGRTKPEDEVILACHITHPRGLVSDDASGCGLILEIARVIKKLIDENKIKLPKRSIKFLFATHVVGSMAHTYHHYCQKDRMVGGLALDMVAEDLDKTGGGPLFLIRTPDSLPSYLPDFYHALLKEACKESSGFSPHFRFQEIKYNFCGEPCAFVDSTVGVPMVQFTCHNIYHHTNYDCVEKTSPKTLWRIGRVATLGTLIIANAGFLDILRIICEVIRFSSIRISEVAAETISKIISMIKSGASRDELVQAGIWGIKKIRHILSRDVDAVRSTLRLLNLCTTSERARLNKICEHSCHELKQKAKIEEQKLIQIFRTLTGIDLKSVPSKKCSELNIVPKRLYLGLFPMRYQFFEFISSLYDEWLKSYPKEELEELSTAVILEILNYIDGSRNITEIAEKVSLEYGYIKPEYVELILRVMENFGFVKLETIKKGQSRND